MRKTLLSLAPLPLLACGIGSLFGPETAPPSGDDTDTHVAVACVDAEPILDQLGGGTGYVLCANGGMDRVASWAGDPDTYAAEYGDPSQALPDSAECATHADCGDPRQRCVTTGWCGPLDAVCAQVCGSDGDCQADEVCVPPEAHGGWIGWPVCVGVSDCRTGDDCASGECGLAEAGGEPRLWLACRPSESACRGEDDCESHTGTYCGPGTDGWSCREYFDCD